MLLMVPASCLPHGVTPGRGSRAVRVMEPMARARRPRNMRARAVALGMVIGLAAAGVTACGTGSAATGLPPGPAVASAGGAVASPAVIVTMPAVPGGGTAPAGRILSHRRALTVADNGATVRLRVGQSVVVALAGRGLVWDVPKASGDAVRRISASGGYPTSRPARAIFGAVRPGQSSLTSVTDAQCLHSRPGCEIPQRLWHVLIIVRNRSLSLRSATGWPAPPAAGAI